MIGTMMVQLVCPLVICRPLTVMLTELAVADTVPPVQVPVTAPPLAIKPAGRLSVKLNVCVGLPAGCVMVNVRLLLPPTTMLVGENALVTAGTAGNTFTQAPEPTGALPPTPATESLMSTASVFSAEKSALALVLLAWGQTPTVGDPETEVVTFTVMVQTPASVTRLAVMVLLPETATTPVPPMQVPPTPFGLATINPGRRLSVKPNVVPAPV